MAGEAGANEPGLVLALGGGGARGLAHIGVLQALAEYAVPVRAVVGTSIGAEIGAFYASGMSPDEIDDLATAFDWKQTLQLFLPDLTTGGLVSGRKIMDFLRTRLGSYRIEKLSMGYAAVATDLESGEAVVLQSGPLVDAVRASISLPGLITPHRIGTRYLLDGSVLNPLPFDVARSLFGGPVLAVAVHAGAYPSAWTARSSQWPVRVQQLLRQPWTKRAEGLRAWLEAQLNQYRERNNGPAWTTRRVLDQALDLTQAEVVRLRAAASPPDLLLVPEVGRIGPLEFYRADEAIAAGYEAMTARLDELKKLMVSGRRISK